MVEPLGFKSVGGVGQVLHFTQVSFVTPQLPSLHTTVIFLTHVQPGGQSPGPVGLGQVP